MDARGSVRCPELEYPASLVVALQLGELEGRQLLMGDGARAAVMVTDDEAERLTGD